VHVVLGEFQCTLEPRAPISFGESEDELLTEKRFANDYRRKKDNKAMSEEDIRRKRADIERELFSASESS
jgi:hypothetical protein